MRGGEEDAEERPGRARGSGTDARAEEERGTEGKKGEETRGGEREREEEGARGVAPVKMPKER